MVQVMGLWCKWWDCGASGGTVVQVVEMWRKWWDCDASGGTLVQVVGLRCKWWDCGAGGGTVPWQQSVRGGKVNINKKTTYFKPLASCEY